MTVSHCPLCPLIFQFRTEVEDHLRNDHRSRADEEADLGAELEAADNELSWLRLRALQCAVSDPSVSLLLDTVPAPAMIPLDAARLRRLAERARQRLALELAGGELAHMEHRLARAIAAAQGGPTDAGLAVFVSARQVVIMRLPLAPKERVVVDPTFATRDLLDALQHRPRYRVAVLSRSGARLFEGRAHSLTEVSDACGAREPTQALPRGVGGSDPARPESWVVRHLRRQALVARTDSALDARSQAAGRLPLVVVGAPRFVALFRRRSRHECDAIGHIRRGRSGVNAMSIHGLVTPDLEAWQRRLADEQAAEFEQAVRQGKVAWGVQAALAAILADGAEHLWVERGYAVPARRAEDGTLRLVDDPETPGVIDDVVDGLIVIATRKGIPTDIIEHWSPASAHGTVVVQLRRPATTPSEAAAVPSGA